MSTGQQWGTVLGGVIGGIYGGVSGAQWGMAIGGYVGGVIDPTIIKGPSIGDAQAQTSLGGAPIPKCYGHTPPIAPTLIDGDKIARKIRRQQDVGKGATSKTETEGWIATRAFLVCEGEIAGYARITRNGKLVYSTIAGDSIDGDSAAFASQITIYTGSETQGPDPSLEAMHGVGNTPYYRGRSYFVVRDDDETQTGGVPNQYRVEVIAAGTTDEICTDATFPWVHGYTGTSQSIFDIALGDGVYFVSGWNDNLRRSLNGQAWEAIEYTTNTTWDPSFAIANIWYGNGIWYMAIYNSIANSFDQGANWHLYENPTPVHEIAEQSVGFSGGNWWAGATGTTNTTIFQPLSQDDTDVDFGADYGVPTWIGDLNGARYVGTNDGKILTGSSTLVHTAPVVGAIRSMAYGAGVILAAWDSGGYSRYDGVWTDYSTGSVMGFVFLRGLFYRCTPQHVQTSPDGLAPWTEVDGLFEMGADGQHIATNGRDILATSQFGDTTFLPQGFMLPDIAGAFINEDGDIVGICNERITADSAVWKDVVEDVAGRASSMLPARLDIAHMTDEVPGFVLGNASLTGTEYVRTMCTWYFTTMPEYDGQLHAVRLGGSVVATFNEDDLLAVEDEDDDVRTQAIQAYQRVTVMYPDPANKYIPTPQTAPRTSPDVTANSNVTIECPFPFDADTVAQKADIMQKIAFLQVEGGFTRAFPAEYSKYVPSDPIVFRNRRHIITRTRNDDCMVQFECTYDRPSAYTSLAVGSNAPAPEGQASNLKGPTMFWAGNLPRLHSADNVPGMYVGACGILDGWVGCDLELSTDGGVTFRTVLRMLNEATLGKLTANVTASGEPITVKVYPHGALNSITSEQLAARENAFAITTASVEEIGQFQTATETLTEHEYDMTDTVRGGLDTTATAHYLGDPFALLDDSIYFLRLDSSLIGQTLIFRPVTLGTAPANNQTYTVVFQPLFTGPETVTYYTDQTGSIYQNQSGSYYQVQT